MKKTMSVAAAIIMTASLAVNADVIYHLNAKATGGAGGVTFDGSDWSTAFTNIESAVGAMNAAYPQGATLRMAQGVYYTARSGGHIVTNSAFRFAGGYRAQADGDLVRDPDLYQTIVSGLASWNTATWKRRVPNIENGGTAYGITETDTKSKIFTANGTLAAFPAYTGTYDCFITSSPAGTYRAFTISNSGAGVFDGVWFFGFNRVSSGSGSPLALGGNGVTVTNCVFFGNAAQGGTIQMDGNDIVTNCRFLHNYAQYGGGAGIAAGNDSRIINCEFTGCSRNIEGYDGGLVISGYSRGVVVSNCVITRSVSRHSSVSTYQSALVCLGDYVLTDCIITNNYVSSDSYYGEPLVVLGGVNSAGTIYGGGVMSRCLVAGNYADVKPVDGKAYVLLGANKVAWNTVSSVFHDCVIRNNTIAAPAVGLSSGSYAMGVIGHGENDETPSRSMRMSVVGCAFVSNTVSAVSVENVTPVLSHGALSACVLSGSTPEIGIANCTFRGPKVNNQYAIAQWGGTHSLALNVVNCLFEPDGDNAVADDVFYADVPALVKARHCTFKNLLPVYRPADIDLADGLEIDGVPFEWVPFLGSFTFPAPVPRVRMPGIRTTCDLATNNIERPMTFAFRPPGASTWLPLTPGSSTSTRSDIAAGDADLFGVARAAGATTRGAVQSLANGAAAAKTLVIRREPPTAGRVSPGYAQAVAAGETPAALTATPEGSATFVGWYDAGGSCLSVSTTYTPLLSGDETIITAKFGTRLVTIVFDLEGYGTFDASGLSTFTTNGNAGAEFPAVPVFTPGDEWFFVSWPGVPALVPDTTATLTYKAKFVTTALRTVYVTPEGAGSQDGSSWANAYGDIAAAYADAGTCRGEVWLREGVYHLPASVTMISDVAVIGGFAGGETSASQANPAAHPTVISGDTNGDDFWKPEGTDPGAGNRTSVWNGTSFTSPNPDWAQEYWSVGSVSASDNVGFGFQNVSGSARNGAFRNLIFTGFGKSAIYSISGLAAGLVIENCRFLANNVSRDLNYAPLFVADVPDTVIRGCEFIGNCRGIYMQFQSETTNTVENCIFDGNRSCALNVNLPSNSWTNQLVSIGGCVFRKNFSNSGIDYPAAIYIYQGVCKSTVDVEGCVFSSNVVRGASVSVARSHGGTNGSDRRFIRWTRARFIGNKAYSSDNNSIFTAGLRVGGNGTWTRIYDSYFGGNEAHYTGTGAGSAASAIGFFDQNGYSTTVNCTFENNTATSASASCWACTAGEANIYAHHGLANCVFARNAFSNTADATKVAEFALSNVDWYTDMRLFNCVLYNASASYRPIVISKAMPLVLNHCAISNYSAEEANIAAMLHANGSIVDVSESDPLVRDTAETGASGAKALRLKSISPFRHAALAVYTDNSGFEAVRDAMNFPAAPWRFVCPCGGRSLNDATAGQRGYSTANEPLPDAFGMARRSGKIAYGPLNGAAPGTALIIR